MVDGWIRMARILQKSSVKSRSLTAHRGGKDQCSETFFYGTWCYAFTSVGFFPLSYGYLRKSLWVPYSDRRVTDVSHYTTPLSEAHASHQQETFFKSYALLVSLQTVIWSSVRERRLILLWNTELGKIYQCLVGDWETLSINGWLLTSLGRLKD